MESSVGFPQGPFVVSRVFLFWRWLVIVLFGACSVVVVGGYTYVYFVAEPIALRSVTWLEVISLAGGVVVAALFGFFPWMAWRQMRSVVEAARHGVLQLAPLVSRERVIAEGQNTGAEKVVFRVRRPNGAVMDVDWQLRTHGHRLLTADGGAAVLAVVPPDNPMRSILMLDSFYPLVFSSADAERVRGVLTSLPPIGS